MSKLKRKTVDETKNQIIQLCTEYVPIEGNILFHTCLGILLQSLVTISQIEAFEEATEIIKKN